jgi:hypothetical protein
MSGIDQAGTENAIGIKEDLSHRGFHRQGHEVSFQLDDCRHDADA